MIMNIINFHNCERFLLVCKVARCFCNGTSNSFKWKHFVGEIILLNVRWYLKYPLSYRNLKEMMIERGIQVDHSTIMRWVHQYSPEIEKKIRRHLRPTNDSWRVDETYIKVKGKWKYFYRAVDSNGNTIDFMLSAKRNQNKSLSKKYFASDEL